MKSVIFLLLLLVATQAIHAQAPGIDQDSELITVPAGDKFLRWYGHAGRSYFLQVSDPDDHLRKWSWAPVIEAGNDEEISYEVDGTAPKGFFRLKYTDQVPGTGFTLESADFDSDGLSNWDEIALHSTDPLNPDTDADGLDDGYEILFGTNPHNADTDGDGLSDYDEVWFYSTDPKDPDSDGDGLDDGTEINQTSTSPNTPDTDGDSISDGDEVSQGTDPNDPASFAFAWRRVTRSLAYDYDDYPPPYDTGHLNLTAEWDTALNSSQPLSAAIPFPELDDRLENLVFPPTPPSFGWQNGLAPSEGQSNLIPNPPCYHATMNHQRLWLRRGTVATTAFQQGVIIVTKRTIDGVVQAPVYETKSVTIPAGETVSDPVDLKSGFTTDFTGNESHSESFTQTLYPVEVVDKAGAALEELKVGKMYPDVIRGTGLPGNPVTVSLDADVDRFFVRVKDGASLGTIKMKFGTLDNPDASYDDDPTEYTLETKDGDATTKSMVLVSDDMDDHHEASYAGGKPDNSPDDRTHKIQLGGNFTISEIKVAAGSWIPVDLKLPVKKKKTVRVQFVNCTRGALGFYTPCWDASLIDSTKEFMKERYAQVGVDFDFQPVVTGANVGVSGTLGNNDILYLPSGTGKIVFPQATQDLIDHGPANDLHQTLMIYLVDGLGTGPYYAGVASPAKYVDAPDIRFKNKMFLSRYRNKDFTAAHEALHVLADAAHDVAPYDDFSTEHADQNTVWTVPPENESARRVNGSIGSTKRISPAQEVKIHSSPLAK